MDPFILALIVVGLLWTAFFGVVPPLIVGWFSFHQGKRGYDEAIESRDAAFSRLDDIQHELLKKPTMPAIKIPVIKIPDEEIEKLRKSLIQGVKGSIGGLMSGQSKMVNGEIQQLSDDIQANMTDEEKEALMISKFKNAMFQKAIDWAKS